ncbi:hypothetical protein VB716_06850 [Synechococcus sp. CCY9201]|uniref:hypothetical protein n=1 Tax=unclassified Synechococcus TaxID=2626047 RepID=UPI002AD4EEBA|nr:MULTISPECIES: hypothetical protein [unclassified Synechococcus]MEA5423833.1 hypothetical protein [Synechococcus sp. CCY9202]MEA5473939.1 hypothetical protein [Synechococcus sp. CCY9201]CAK6691290.1 hypothetical protein IFHNHDMJ_00988 [Synechococcus sp. CBW1107]
MRLEPLELWLKPAPGALLPQIRAALADQPGGAEPLRWAITAVDPDRGLRVEGVWLLSTKPPC